MIIDEESVISIVNTSCKDCCFAQYDEDTQTGCALNLFDKLTDNGAEIVESYDEDKNFYVINGKICLYKRNERWAQYYKNVPTLDKIVRQELSIKYCTAILCPSTSTFEDLKQTIKMLINQSLKPGLITIAIMKGCRIRPSEVKAWIKDVETKWTIELVIQQNQEIEAVAHIVAHNVKAKFGYYSIFLAGFTNLDPDFFKKLDSLVNDELERIGIVRPIDDSINGLTIMNGLSKQISGLLTAVEVLKLDKKEQEEWEFLLKSHQSIIDHQLA